MKRTNISIFIPHLGCPHRCSFCDQRSISGARNAPTADEVRELLEGQATHLEQIGAVAEIAFFGGSFTAIEHDYMESLLKVASDAVQRYPAYSGIRCSTRPDSISERVLDTLRSYGVTAIELGAQSMSDLVLEANGRGHSAEDVRTASRLIKSCEIELGLQMMTGLYRDSADLCRFTANEFIKLKPKTVRIYPTVILRGTRLGELFERGEYASFSFEETVDLCAELLQRFTENQIRVIRLGLHASPDIERDKIGGVYHPALREIVESRIMLRELKMRLSGFPKGYYHVYTDPKNVSKLIGQKRCNIKTLADLGYEIDVLPLEGEYLLIK